MNNRARKSLGEAPLAAYFLAVGCIVIAAGGRSLLNQITGPQIPLVTFHLAVLVAGLSGGLGPALVGLGLGYLLAGFAFAAPRGPFGVFGMPDLWATAAYVVGGVAVAGSGTAVRSLRRKVVASEQQATHSRAELQRHLQQVESTKATLNEPARDLPQASAPRQPARIPAENRVSLGLGRRIHVVDDARDSADSLALLLKMDGHEVDVSYDGISALAADAPDVMIIDIDLPDIDGYELARRLRIDPRFTRTFLIALSGFGLDEDRARAISAGFHSSLTKPLDFVALRELIDGL